MKHKEINNSPERQLNLCKTQLRLFEQNLVAIREQEKETARRIILLKKEIEQLKGDKNV